MNCFVFPGVVPYRVCGVTTREDMERHLLDSGVTGMHSPDGSRYSQRIPYEEAEQKLGSGWLAVYPEVITRQSPLALRNRTRTAGASCGASLACSRSPWEGVTVLTDGKGFVTDTEMNPAPESASTNLCFSGMVWVECRGFRPDEPFAGSGVAAFLLPGYCMTPFSLESLLLASRDVLTGKVNPWPHFHLPSDGMAISSPIPDSTSLRGFIWVDRGVSIEGNCELENCVIMSGASVGHGSRLKNCMIPEGVSVRRNTIRVDKYLTCLGECDG